MVAGSAAELTNELKILRKGRGLQTPKLIEQVGPMLRQLCGIASTDGSAMVREKLTDRLRILSDQLPDDLRLTVMIALALQPDTQQQFLQDRVQFLAGVQKRDVRTIRRRMDDGFELLAEIAMKAPETGARGSGFAWYIDRVESILRLDKQTPECFERRTIVAERDGLDTVQAMITVPRDTDRRAPGEQDLQPELYFGATLLRRQRKHEQRFVYDLGLPRPLMAGDRHEYGMIFRIPPDQPMRDHYVLFPDRRCEEFRLRIRFDQAGLPAKLWRVVEAFHRDVDDRTPTEPLLSVDRIGEITLTFHGLLPGHGYGAQWLSA